MIRPITFDPHRYRITRVQMLRKWIDRRWRALFGPRLANDCSNCRFGATKGQCRRGPPVYVGNDLSLSANKGPRFQFPPSLGLCGEWRKRRKNQPSTW